jgi:hypothetical protein
VSKASSQDFNLAFFYWRLELIAALAIVMAVRP